MIKLIEEAHNESVLLAEDAKVALECDMETGKWMRELLHFEKEAKKKEREEKKKRDDLGKNKPSNECEKSMAEMQRLCGLRREAAKNAGTWARRGRGKKRSVRERKDKVKRVRHSVKKVKKGGVDKADAIMKRLGKAGFS